MYLGHHRFRFRSQRASDADLESVEYHFRLRAEAFYFFVTSAPSENAGPITPTLRRSRPSRKCARRASTIHTILYVGPCVHLSVLTSPVQLLRLSPFRSSDVRAPRPIPAQKAPSVVAIPMKPSGIASTLPQARSERVWPTSSSSSVVTQVLEPDPVSFLSAPPRGCRAGLTMADNHLVRSFP